MRKPALSFFLFLLCFQGYAQICSGPGQTPSRAFPVCGTVIFHQTTVPICVTQDLEVPGCSNNDYQDKNPYWYRFTCYESGSLGFLIQPLEQGDDYDWQLYDITGRDPQDVFTDKTLIVTGNWAGTSGNTGASSAGVDFIQCGSIPSQKKNTFSKMPQLIVGHTYILLVSHFDGDSQSGYDLSFGGGTAVITNPVLPAFSKAEAACNGSTIRMKLNKKIKCTSIATDGSDFYVTTTDAAAISAEGIECFLSFDTDSLVINLNATLGPGTYQLHAKKGSDGNTLLDYCDNSMPETDVISFTVFPFLPTPMDSIGPVTCAPQTLKLHFRKPMSCSTIAPNGSDFKITGTYPVAITGAAGVCNANGTSREIIVTLSKPLQQKGSFNLVLQQGNDGNTLLDECAKETPAGASLPFSVKDTVNADFTYAIRYGCSVDTVNYFHNGANEVNTWKWNLDEKKGTAQNIQAMYTIFNEKNISLSVSNGFCNDTAQQKVLLDNFLKADFEVVLDNCPMEEIPFTSTAIGKIKNHNWTFGDGKSSIDKSPKHIYTQSLSESLYQVKYTITDNLGCEKSITKPVKIYSSCTIYIPNAFTPNNDGRNDFFGVFNAVKAANFQLRIYNRWGQLLFHSNNWKETWDGKTKGLLQGSGTFVWFVKYTDSRTNQPVERKGTVVLIR